MDFNILGMGLPEMVVIAVLLMMVAGPKRMVRWAYMAGRYLSQIRAYADEAIGAMKREIEAADPELMNDLQQVNNLRKQNFNIVNEANKLIAPVTPVVTPLVTTPAPSPAPTSTAAAMAAMTTARMEPARVDPSAAPVAVTVVETASAKVPEPAAIDDRNTSDTDPASSESKTYDAWLPR